MTFAAQERMPVEQVERWIEESYRAVAPGKLSAQLATGSVQPTASAQPTGSAKPNRVRAKTTTASAKRARVTKRP